MATSPVLLTTDALKGLWWDYVTWAIETAGPTLIKLAQWITTRPDLIDSHIISRLEKLQDDTKPHAFDHTVKMMRKCFGEAWESHLELDERSPILGSGSIAQVYKGYHRQQQRHVAVKVLHPNVHEVIEEDISLLRSIAEFSEWLRPDLRFMAIVDTVDEFGSMLDGQLDLRTEGHNLSRLRENFRHLDTLDFPEPLQGLSAREVLVESFLEGQPLLNMVGQDGSQRLGILGCQVVLEMLFYHNFVHGDLHPGNLLYTKDGKIGILDAGICMEMDEDHHATMMIVLTSFMKNDGKTAALRMVDTSRKHKGKDVNMFVRGIEKMVEDAHSQNFFEHAGEYVTDICALACRHHVKLDSIFITTALTLKLIEGTALQLDPTVSLIEMGLPMAVSNKVRSYLKLKSLNFLS